ncbi:hypothetical protein ACJMK2_023806 [Sinanodonta woodiana]|uniref:Uncharacterized protein n=1 Tax=Sinanodonta woodiana TaxID=1069815 RepID=A0ABD3T6C9_SINWO
MFSGIVTTDIQGFIEAQTRDQEDAASEERDGFLGKMAAFDRLLQHTMSRFSKERLYAMLRIVTYWALAEERKKSESLKEENRLGMKFKSLDQLKGVVSSLKDKGKTSGLRIEEDQAVRYFETFFNDFFYLKDLKKYFDDELMYTLHRYYYDQNADNESEPKVKTKSREKAEENDIKKMTLNEPAKKRKGSVKAQATGNSTAKKFEQVKSDLLEICKKWDGLLKDGDLNLNDFDPDSYHELLQFVDYSQFEPILRLVPDIFAKCYKSIDLAKQWMNIANAVRKDIPTKTKTRQPAEKETAQVTPPTEEEQQRTTSKEFIRQIMELKDQLSDMDISISKDEQQLQEYTTEIEGLHERENRFDEVTSTFQRMDSLVSDAGDQYLKAKEGKSNAVKQIQTFTRESAEYAQMYTELKRMDEEVTRTYNHLKLMEFQKSIVQEDYLVEMEVRPSFIYFVADTKEKIHELQFIIEAKKEEKRRIEKNIMLLKTNTERMRNVMSTYLGSGASFVSGQVESKQSTWDSFITDGDQTNISDELSEVIIENGNEADNDSLSPNDAIVSHGASLRQEVEPSTHKSTHSAETNSSSASQYSASEIKLSRSRTRSSSLTIPSKQNTIQQTVKKNARVVREVKKGQNPFLKSSAGWKTNY